ncbi:hypothetical protein pclt_cds_536 [Pandoravirus celtis]|uniref:Uncharacterized protein n=1 Tax=Pandoravirus celtis TaxID=2568002 RepID=A0A4D6EH41_9VIRU|nr:hypothetical protein pclt_cds_536 [Pandoravirus celtis]
MEFLLCATLALSLRDARPQTKKRAISVVLKKKEVAVIASRSAPTGGHCAQDRGRVHAGPVSGIGAQRGGRDRVRIRAHGTKAITTLGPVRPRGVDDENK